MSLCLADWSGSGAEICVRRGARSGTHGTTRHRGEGNTARGPWHGLPCDQPPCCITEELEERSCEGLAWVGML